MFFFNSLLTWLMFLQNYVCAKEMFTKNFYDDNNIIFMNSLEHSSEPKSRYSACVPNSYAIIDCNICYCNSNGEIDEERCTRNICDPREVSRRSSKIYDECEKGTWYSIAPCQFCYCVNKNKLLCNSRNHFTKTINIGDHDLRDCGKDFLQDALVLLNDKKLKANNEESKPADTNINVVETPDDGPLNDIDENKYERNDFGNTLENKEISNINSNTKNIDIGVASFENADHYKYMTDLNADANEFKKKDIKHKPKKYKQEEPFLNLKKDLGKTLKQKIPRILDEVLKMAFRRNSLSIRSDPDCEPGTQKYIDCNKCMCLKNGKLLCSKMKCE